MGIGGTTRAASTSEKALRLALAATQLNGAEIAIFTGPDLDLPMYLPGVSTRCDKAAALIRLLRQADGIVLASPGYHGSVSGLIKNALDYAEDMSKDNAAYFEGRAIGIIACAAGWQAASSTLQALRAIVHALRGWPTPLGVAINTISSPFNTDGSASDPAVATQLDILAAQVMDFARMRTLSRSLGSAAGIGSTMRGQH